MKHLFISVILLTLIWNPLLAQKKSRKQQAPLTLVEAIKVVQPSILKIEVGGIDPSTGGKVSATGSGFFIDTAGYILTNNHVIENYFRLQEPYLVVKLDASKIYQKSDFFQSFIQVGCRVVARDPKKDLALLDINSNPFNGKLQFISAGGKSPSKAPGSPTLPKLCRREIEDGERIAVSGYPLSYPSLITTSGYIASAWYPDVYHADLIVNHGNSGGPVYLVETGEIIGVAVSFGTIPIELRNNNGQPIAFKDINMAYNSGISQVIKMKTILQFLEENNIKISQ